MANVDQRIDQIRRAHASAKPKNDNPAWVNTHHDLGFVLSVLDVRTQALNKYSELLRSFRDAAQDTLASGVPAAHLETIMDEAIKFVGEKTESP